MISWRTIILVLMALVLSVVAIATRGSIGSVTMVMCLILMGLSLLFQKFLTNRDDDYFNMEQ